MTRRIPPSMNKEIDEMNDRQCIRIVNDLGWTIHRNPSWSSWIWDYDLKNRVVVTGFSPEGHVRLVRGIVRGVMKRMAGDAR